MMNTIGNSRPFALWSVISVTRPSSSRSPSASASSAICWRNVSTVRSSPPPGCDVELARDADELLEVLDPPLRLDRPLGLERVEVAASRAASPRAARRPTRRRRRSRRRSMVDMKRPSAFDRRLAERRHRLGVRGHLPRRDAHRLRVGEHARERRLPDAALGRVGDPRERAAVGRVDEERQVRDRVLDLRPLVELRAADHLVADLRAHEHVLEHARLRVHPVEDGDLGAADALVDEPLDLGRDEARLGVLVGELAHLDRVALAEVGPQRA